MPGIRDFHMAWKTKRLWIPKSEFNVLGTAGAGVVQSNGAAVEAAAAGGSELVVLQVGAAGDEFATFRPIPWDLDRNKQVLGRIWFIHSSTDADTPDWLIKSKFLANQATVVDTDTADDATGTFSAKTVSTTAESLERTDWVDLSWDDYIASTDVAVQLLVECNGLGSASANEIEFLGVELMYQIEATQEAAARTAIEVSTQPA